MRFISGLKLHTDWKWKNRKKHPVQNENKRKAGIAILISNKTDFKTKTIKDKER